MLNATLSRRSDRGNTYYTLKLEGGHEAASDFQKLYGGKLKIYPSKLSYGVVGMQEQSTLEFLIIVCGEQSK